METIKIAWMDQHIYNGQNSGYIEAFPFKYELRTFTKVEETIIFLEADPNSWVLVTSGRDGEALVSRAAAYPNVLGIIIFCMKVNKHKKWARNYPIVKHVVNRFCDVLENAWNIFNNYVTHCYIQLVKNPSDGVASLMNAISPNASGDRNDDPNFYYHMESELEMSFLMIIKLALKDKNRRDAVLKEFLNLDPSKKNEIEGIFNQNKKDLLKSIVYIYTSNLVYKPLNESYAANNYSRVMNITAAAIRELKLRESKLMLKDPLTVLHRGAKIKKKQLAKYVVGDFGFWSPFTSTSTSEAVSAQFRKNAQFEVHLSERSPHPHIVLSKGWSMFTEHEVLLLPYFPFTITAIEDFPGYKKITVHQNEEHISLALNSDTLRDYWLNRLWNEISIPFNNLCEQIHHRISVSINYKNYFYIQNPEYQNDTKFKQDLVRAIYFIYEDMNKHNSYKDRFHSNASMINYWGILENDIIKTMSKWFLKKQIEVLFMPDFKEMTENLSRVMRDEVVATFGAPLDLFEDCVRNIFKGFEKYLIQSAPDLNHNNMQPNDKYIDIFCAKVILSIDQALVGKENDIDHLTNKVRKRLYEQLEKLKMKIGISLGEILL